MSTSITTISQRENTPKAINLLAAQRYRYSAGKAIQFWHMIGSLPVVIALSLLSSWFPSPILKAVAAGWGALMVILDIFVVTSRQTKLKEEGARIQELFDCEVLQLPWRNLKCDPRPSEESLMRYAAAFKHKHKRDPDAMKSLQMWYPEAVDKLPAHLGRLVCQRINCWWNGTLRRDYANQTLIGSLLLVIALVAVALLAGSSVPDLILNFVAISPLIVWGFRQFTDNAVAADRLDKLHSHVQELWLAALEGSKSPDDLARESRDLQDEIFDMRRRNPLIFDWIYKTSRAQREVDMDQIAQDLVQQAQGATPSP